MRVIHLDDVQAAVCDLQGEGLLDSKTGERVLDAILERSYAEEQAIDAMLDAVLSHRPLCEAYGR